MSSIERPKLRDITAFPVNLSGRQMICLQDPLRFIKDPVFVPEDVFFIISLFDGEHSILDIQEQYMRQYGNLLMSNQIRRIINDLDSSFLLEGERFEEYKRLLSEDFSRLSVRTAFHAGEAYESDPDRLRDQLKAFFVSPDGSGELNKDVATPNNIKGIVAPHIDITRGGTCYAWGYKEIGERCDAELFVIFGTSHFPSKNAFILTNKDFQTPFGLMPVDKDFIRSISEKYKQNLYEDELIHKFEHSIEFQVVFIQYVLEKNVKIVPILCSSFSDMIEADTVPSETQKISDFVSALKETMAQSGQSVCFIAGADLSHVGRRFGDQVELSSVLLETIRSRDMEMLGYVEQMDAVGFFNSIQKDKDDRKVCGLPPIYMLLSVMKASQGKILNYSQSPEYNTGSVVSFASISFR